MELHEGKNKPSKTLLTEPIIIRIQHPPKFIQYSIVIFAKSVTILSVPLYLDGFDN